MAIFDKIECSIMINDVAAHEYDCPSDEGNSDPDDNSSAGPFIKKYIPSQADQNFAVQIQLQEQFKFGDCNALTCHIYIDGNLVANPLLRKAKFKSTGLTSKRIGTKSNVDGEWTLRKFRFSKLRADDVLSNRSVANFKKLQHLGEIEARVYRTNTRGGPDREPHHREGLSVPDLSEKHMKGRAIDSFTTLDVPIPSEPRETWTTDLVDTQPLVTFIFHYRSIDVLQQIGVVEQPLSIRPLEDRDPAGLTLEETRELIRRQKEVIQQQEDTEKLMKKRLRQEQARHNLRTLDAIKRARSPSPQDDGDEVDNEEVQIIKRARKDRKIEVVELY